MGSGQIEVPLCTQELRRTPEKSVLQQQWCQSLCIRQNTTNDGSDNVTALWFWFSQDKFNETAEWTDNHTFLTKGRSKTVVLLLIPHWVRTASFFYDYVCGWNIIRLLFLTFLIWFSPSAVLLFSLCMWDAREIPPLSFISFLRRMYIWFLVLFSTMNMWSTHFALNKVKDVFIIWFYPHQCLHQNVHKTFNLNCLTTVIVKWQILMKYEKK